MSPTPTLKDLPLNKEYLLKIAPVISAMRVYHEHSTIGLDQIPDTGVIMAANHSLASYDIALLMASIYEHCNRVPRALIVRLFFKVPGLGPLMQTFGSREGTRENAVNMLRENEILVVAPGGMREALRPSSEKYKIIWKRRKGFVKLSVETGAPIILAACPAADDLYDVAPSHITVWAYQTLRIPLFFAKGLGFTAIPKPVKLTHYLSEPLYPPPYSNDPEIFKKHVEEFHLKVTARMEKLMLETAQKA